MRSKVIRKRANADLSSTRGRLQLRQHLDTINRKESGRETNNDDGLPRNQLDTWPARNQGWRDRLKVDQDSSDCVDLSEDVRISSWRTTCSNDSETPATTTLRPALCLPLKKSLRRGMTNFKTVRWAPEKKTFGADEPLNNAEGSSHSNPFLDDILRTLDSESEGSDDALIQEQPSQSTQDIEANLTPEQQVLQPDSPELSRIPLGERAVGWLNSQTKPAMSDGNSYNISNTTRSFSIRLRAKDGSSRDISPCDMRPASETCDSQTSRISSSDSSVRILTHQALPSSGSGITGIENENIFQEPRGCPTKFSGVYHVVCNDKMDIIVPPEAGQDCRKIGSEFCKIEKGDDPFQDLDRDTADKIGGIQCYKLPRPASGSFSGASHHMAFSSRGPSSSSTASDQTQIITRSHWNPGAPNFEPDQGSKLTTENNGMTHLDFEKSGIHDSREKAFVSYPTRRLAPDVTLHQQRSVSNEATRQENIPPPRRVVLDDPDAHGRQVNALPQWYADMLLASFTAKYPLTGKKAAQVPGIARKSVSRRPPYGDSGLGPKNAAAIQQRLEYLLMQSREERRKSERKTNRTYRTFHRPPVQMAMFYPYFTAVY